MRDTGIRRPATESVTKGQFSKTHVYVLDSKQMIEYDFV